MIRLRSQKLLAGVSGIAVLASLGVVNPALATTQTFTGSNLFPAIVVAPTDTAITVTTQARIDIDGAGASLTNAAGQNITGATDIVTITSNSLLFGDVVNNGTLNSTAGAGILLSVNSDIDGTIINAGRIIGTTFGIDIEDSTLVGGINNTVAGSRITGGTAGIKFGGNTVIKGGVTNAGTIAGTTGPGIDFQDVDIDFKGNITNTQTGTISTAGAGIAAVNLQLFSEFTGNIANSGLITAPGAGSYGIRMWTTAGTLTGDISNTSTGQILAAGLAGIGISVEGGILDGNINNAGTITTAGISIFSNGGTITGEIFNDVTGTITSTGAATRAIELNGTAEVDGGIHNAGTIKALGASGSANAIFIGGTTVFSGGITNDSTGLISANGGTAVLINNGTFTGDFTNDGSIVSTSLDGVHIGPATGLFNGDFINNGVIKAAQQGVEITGTLFQGDVINTGTIDPPTTGMLITVGTLDGDFNNDGGTILGTNFGVSVGGATQITGDFSNTGGLIASTNRDAVHINGTVAGDFNNSGNIVSLDNAFGTADPAAATGGEDAVDINGTVVGDFNNTGSLVGYRDGIDLDGTVMGTIFNSSVIIGVTEAGIDLGGASGAQVITQTAGLIRGGLGGEGSIEDALYLNNGNLDTFNGNGGAIDGNIRGDGTDDVLMNPTGTFAWFRGKGNGIDHFNVLGGTVILGAEARGATGVAGQGVEVTFANSMVDNGWAYLDDDTDINVTTTLSQGVNGVLEYLLTPDTSTHGRIDAGGVASIAGRGAVYIDAATFADPLNSSGPGVFGTYTQVVTGSSVSANFTNGGTLLSSTPFFSASSLRTNGNTQIDIILTRLDMADVLNAMLATETFNQNSVATGLEGVYAGGEYGQQFQGLYQYLFTSGRTAAEIQYTLDELSGAEHAQLQGAVLRTSSLFDTNLRMRLDDTIPTESGMVADLGLRRYAQATISASDSMGSGPGGSHGLTRGPSGVSMWVRGFGQWANVDGDPEAQGYDQDTTGVSGGIDYAVSPNATIGLGGHWANDSVDFDHVGDSADIDSWGIGGYGSYSWPQWYIDGLVSYADHSVDTHRLINIVLPDPFDPLATIGPFTALASYDSTTWSVDGEVGYLWRMGRATLQPALGLAYMDLSTDAFAETGAGAFGLIADGADDYSLASTLSLRAYGQYMMGRTPIVPDFRLGWRHEFNNDLHNFTTSFNELNSPVFTIVSSDVQQDSAVVRAGFTAGVTNNFEVFLDFDGQYSSDAAASAGSGGVRVTW